MTFTTNRLYYLFLSPLQERDYRGWGPSVKWRKAEDHRDAVNNIVTSNDR